MLFNLDILYLGDNMKQNLFLDVAERLDNPKILIQEKNNKSLVIKHYQVLESNSKELKRDAGDYFVIQFDSHSLINISTLLKREFERIMKSFLKKYHTDKPILVIGLGNSSVMADSFGCKTTNQMIATNQYNDFLTIPKIALFNPEVTEKTGISSFKLIKMVVEDLKPDLILLIDSLATEKESYLNNAIEINDTGIIPGSAMRANKEIKRSTFNIPVISIGAPLMLHLKKGLFLNTQTEQNIIMLSKIVAEGLNQILLT